MYEQYHLLKNFNEYEKIGVKENDFLIINLDEKSFKNCYWYLRSQNSEFVKRNIILLSNKTNAFIIQALLDGEFNYIHKKTDMTNIDRIVHSRLNRQLDGFISVGSKHNLTRAERLILIMILSNIDQKTTAKILNISFKTVSAHKCKILKKIQNISNKSFRNNNFYKYMIN